MAPSSPDLNQQTLQSHSVDSKLAEDVNMDKLLSSPPHTLSHIHLKDATVVCLSDEEGEEQPCESGEELESDLTTDYEDSGDSNDESDDDEEEDEESGVDEHILRKKFLPQNHSY